MAETLLKVEGLQAWYGESHILHGVGFEIGRGELVTLLGRNGAGKTTTLKSVMGIVEKRTGSVTFEGKETVSQPSDVIARLGLAYCPEERGIFSSLNVEENLLLPPMVRPGGMSLGEIYQLFPNTILIWQVDHIEIWRAFPDRDDASRCDVEMTIYKPEGSDKSDAYWEKNRTIAIRTVMDEDFPLGERMQIGFESGATEEVIYGRNEPSLVHFHSSIRNALGVAA